MEETISTLYNAMHACIIRGKRTNVQLQTVCRQEGSISVQTKLKYIVHNHDIEMKRILSARFTLKNCDCDKAHSPVISFHFYSSSMQNKQILGEGMR